VLTAPEKLLIRLDLFLVASENEDGEEKLVLDKRFPELIRGRNLEDSNERGEDVALELRVLG